MIQGGSNRDKGGPTRSSTLCEGSLEYLGSRRGSGPVHRGGVSSREDLWSVTLRRGGGQGVTGPRPGLEHNVGMEGDLPRGASSSLTGPDRPDVGDRTTRPQ